MVALPVPPGPSVDSPRRRNEPFRLLGLLGAPALATCLSVLALLAHWEGGDLAAAIYRVALFQRKGLTLWDSQWYGGHWTLNYSVVFPPIAGILGIGVTGVGSAAGAAWAFDRLVVGHFGRTARLGSAIFAVGTLVPIVIGQLPFLLGEAFALGTCLAASRARWRLAIGLAIVTSLASPLAGAFLALAAASWLLGTWPRHHVGLAAVAAASGAPVLASAVLFPGQGPFPFRGLDLVLALVIAASAWFLVPRRERTLRIGAILYTLAAGVFFVFPSAMGANIVRLGVDLAIPLAACLLWPKRRLLLVALAIPGALIQWTPAWAQVIASDHDASTHLAYYQPLVSFLEHEAQPGGRVEVVPTRLHWEAAYVAPSFPLARGWERQLDTADNPIFYTQGALNATTYDHWLVDNGVRYVALADAPLDYAAVAEGHLVAAGVPGLQLVWHHAHWRVYSVQSSPGIVSGPALLRKLDGGKVDLDVTAPGDVTLRVRYSYHWSLIEGSGCIEPGPQGWTAIQASTPGELELRLRLTGAQQGACAA